MLKRRTISVENLAAGILSGDRAVLSLAITLVESRKQDDRIKSGELLDMILKHTGKSKRIGITGVPGVGKSTFIDNFGTLLTQQGLKVAVLAIDPTSQRTKGSILGDKTRMERLSVDPSAFIRPTAAREMLGGIGSATRETMLLCEAAGFDIIIIETVGVGQSETLVKDMVDFFLLLMLAGAGDELQGIKRGIMEMADAVVINKADGENLKASSKAQAEYQTALHYLPTTPNQWQPKVLTCSARENSGIEEAWKLTDSYFDHIEKNNWRDQNRKHQNLHWLHEKLNFLLKEKFYSNSDFREKLAEAEEQVKNEELSPTSAAMRLMMGHSVG